jgi:hypothetical protein
LTLRGSSLDTEIAQVAGALGVLLVFVAAAISATWATVLRLVDDPKPSVEADRVRLKRRLQ